MKEMNLLVAVNKGYLQEVKDLLFSVYYYNKEYKLNVYLMYIELDQEEIKGLENFVIKKCKGKFEAVKFNQDSINDMPVTDGEGSYFGLEAYSRLFSAYQLSQDLDRLLYLDADMICAGNLSELYNMDLEENCFAACQDKGIKPEDLKRLELPLDYQYINSGVLLMNLKEIRKIYKEKDIVNLIIEQSKVLKYPDQDFINKNFKGKIKIVSSKFNLLAKDVKKEELNFEPIIYHYAGSVKPWNDNVNRFCIEFIKPYYKSLFLEGRYLKLAKLYLKHQKNRKARK